MSDDGWEARMAERARLRREAREADERQRREAALAAALAKLGEARQGDEWLNGWPRLGTSVLMGTCLYCIGCGRFFGVTTVAFPEDWEAPGPDPVWPFDPADCDLCRSGE